MLPRFSISSLAWLAQALVLWSLFFCSFEPRAESAAVNYFLQSWQTDEGLPGNEVNDVVQDADGFIWLATIGGLVRFDGMTFKQFSSPLIARAAARNIRALARTPDGALLMLPAVGGVVQFKDGKFSAHPVANSLSGEQLQTLFVDGSGAVWIGSDNGQAWRWDDGKITSFSPTNGFSRRARITFAADQGGGVWIANGGFLGCYRNGELRHYFENLNATEFTVVAARRSGGIWICQNQRLMAMENGQISNLNTNLPWVPQNGVVRNMFEDCNHVLWFGTTAHGAYCGSEGEFKRVETSQSQITSITQDVEGNLWIGTVGGGLDRLRSKIFHLYNTKSGLPEDVSDSVCTDDQGNVWLANRSSGAARISDGKVSVLPVHIGSRELRAYSVCADHQNFLWVSEGGLYRFPFDHPDQVETVSNHLTGRILGVHVIYQSRHGDVWIGGDPGLLGCFRGGRPENYVLEGNFPGQRPRVVLEDPSGRIWIGTEDRQLFQFADGKFLQFSEKNGLPDAPIRSLCADEDGSLWIGTIGGGLVLWRDRKFTVLTKGNGLPDDDIAEILEDDAGRLWCGSPSGIFYVAKHDLLAFADRKTSMVSATAFNKSEGLAGISCLGTSQPMACKTTNCQLWFVTQQGVLALDSDKLKPNPHPPPVFIDELLFNDQPQVITHPMQVPPLCNKIEFRFSVLSYASPELVRIRYKLDPVDSDWGEIVNQRGAVYSGLRPGKYEMHLKACNNDGVWNEVGTSLSFVVQPAWWQSWWFQSSLLGVCIAAAVSGVRYWSQRRLKLKLERLEHLQAMAKERGRIARDLHDDLGATVTQVGLMLEEMRSTPLSAEEIKQQSAAISGRVLNLARDLDAVVWSVNPGNDSLDELFAYLSQSFLEYFRRTAIRPRLEVMEQVPDCALAPEVRHQLFLVVKEALNNVIKHSQATEVTLSLKIVENVLEIRVEDNGQGVSSQAIAQSKRNGFPNMRARVEQMGGRFETSSEPKHGTSIRILIPSWQDLRPKRH